MYNSEYSASRLLITQLRLDQRSTQTESCQTSGVAWFPEEETFPAGGSHLGERVTRLDDRLEKFESGILRVHRDSVIHAVFRRRLEIDSLEHLELLAQIDDWVLVLGM